MSRKTVKMFIVYCLLAIFIVVAGFPFFWMTSTSLKTDQEVISAPPQFIPSEFYWESYTKVLTDGDFLLYFWNSIKVAGTTTILAMTLAITAGLGFARLNYRWTRYFLIIILFAQLFPLILLITPYFTIMKNLGILNSHKALYLSYTSFVLPFSIWMLSNYFRSIPQEMEHAAMIDGCSRLGALVKVTLPLAAPGIAATTINAFILAWNEFLFAQIFINSPHLRTLPIGLRSFMGQYETQWNLLMAGAVISTIPVVILFIILQKHLISGLTQGGVKG